VVVVRVGGKIFDFVTMPRAEVLIWFGLDCVLFCTIERRYYNHKAECW